MVKEQDKNSTTDLDGRSGPTYTAHRAVKNELEANMTKRYDDCSQVTIENRY